jgi:uncharacterized protein (DUF2384 family)
MKSKGKQNRSKIPPETIEIIRKMAKENRLWGAERIRGELLKVGIKVSKRTIQKYLPIVRKSPSPSQTWATFVKNHARDIWACDFTVAYDWLFRPWFVFVVMELRTRRIVHTAITKSPTDEWTAQQLREATPWGVKEYTAYFNQERPHQGIAQRIPYYYDMPEVNSIGGITSRSILGGLHHGYSRQIYLQ